MKIPVVIATLVGALCLAGCTQPMPPNQATAEAEAAGHEYAYPFSTVSPDGPAHSGFYDNTPNTPGETGLEGGGG